MTISSKTHPPAAGAAIEALAADLAAATQLRNLECLRRGLEHELRSPLNAIVLNVELLKELVRTDGGPSAVVQLERLKAIRGSLDRLQHGLGELLSLTEEPATAPARFDLAALVDEVARLASGQLKQAGIELHLVPAPGELAVRGRREVVHQALLEMVIHALRVSPPEGRIEIATRHHEGWQIVEVRTAARSEGGRPESPGLQVARRLLAREGGELTLGDGPGSLVRARLPEE